MHTQQHLPHIAIACILRSGSRQFRALSPACSAAARNVADTASLAAQRQAQLQDGLPDVQCAPMSSKLLVCCSGQECGRHCSQGGTGPVAGLVWFMTTHLKHAAHDAKLSSGVCCSGQECSRYCSQGSTGPDRAGNGALWRGAGRVWEGCGPGEAHGSFLQSCQAGQAQGRPGSQSPAAAAGGIGCRKDTERAYTGVVERGATMFL